MSTDPHPANAARTTPTTTAGKAHNSTSASLAKTTASKASKKAASAKAPQPQTAAQAAPDAITGQPPHEVVFKLLTGQIDVGNLADLPADVQSLLVTVMLEQRRAVMFDANGTYIAGDSFTGLISQLLNGPNKSRVVTVMGRMRRDRAYRSIGTGAKAKFTFTGTDQARAIVGEIEAHVKASEAPKLVGPTPGPVAVAPPEYAVTGPLPKPGTANAHTLSELLAGSIVENAWRLAGYDPHVIDLVIAGLQNRRSA